MKVVAKLKQKEPGPHISMEEVLKNMQPSFPAAVRF
jgi:hypothetical protein